MQAITLSGMRARTPATKHEAHDTQTSTDSDTDIGTPNFRKPLTLNTSIHVTVDVNLNIKSIICHNVYSGCRDERHGLSLRPGGPPYPVPSRVPRHTYSLQHAHIEVSAKLPAGSRERPPGPWP